MTDRSVGASFRPGYRFQRYWDTSMALAFFSAECASGLFVVSLCIGYLPGMVAGLLLVSTLKPYFHLAHMGVPAKSWRALARPDRSWVSRGAFAVGLMVAFGVLHVLAFAFLADAVPNLVLVTGVLAAIPALVVMCYQGFAMAMSSAFALWASIMSPLSSFLYAATAGLFTVFLFAGEPGGALQVRLAAVCSGILMADLVVVAIMLMTAANRSSGGAYSVALLTRGPYAVAFWGLVVVAGLVAPFLLLQAGASVPLRAVAWLCVLAGFYTFRILLFRVAVYEPLGPGLIGLRAIGRS